MAASLAALTGLKKSASGRQKSGVRDAAVQVVPLDQD
jgi:hypothetical protein